MGSFSVSFAAKGATPGAVAAALRKANREALVAPAVGEITCFYDFAADARMKRRSLTSAGPFRWTSTGTSWRC